MREYNSSYTYKDKEYPSGPLADLPMNVYHAVCKFLGVSIAYTMKGFFYAAGALLAYAIYSTILVKFII